MKSRIISISLCILILLTWEFYPLLAQQGSPQVPGGLQPSAPPGAFGPPQGSQTGSPFLGTQPYSLVPQTGPQGTQTPQPFGASQPIIIIPGSAGQQGSQSTTSSPTLGVPQTQILIVPQTQAGARVPEPLSSIEAAFRDPTVIRTPADTAESPGTLRQFGYSLFARPVSTFSGPVPTVPIPGAVPTLPTPVYTSPPPVSTFAPVDGVPVGPDYILGPGDDLRINVWGAMDNAIVQTVDRNGQIILPTVGPVKVWGLTFSQADRVIREELSRYFRGFQTSVTMGRLRTIRVYVVGKVNQPGSYSLSSLSTVTNGLLASDGPSKIGSLRRIELKRNHHTVGTVDFYDLLLRGDKTSDLRLESGDTIFIPPIGPVAAISGEVKEPAIYELQGPTRVNDLIEMAGGVTPQSYLKRVQVIRAKPNAEREVIDLDLTTLQGNGDSPVNIELRNGDLVKIYPTDPRVYNTISLAGVVKHPGEYEFKPNMRLSQLIPQGSLLPEAYLDGVEVIRFKDDLTTEVLQLNLKQVWAGNQEQDINLRPRDQITVSSEFQGHKSMTLAGEVKLPRAYTTTRGERLSSVIKRAGGFTDKAFLKGAVFTRRSVRDVERKRLDEFMRQHEERLLAERTSTLANIKSISTLGLANIDSDLAQKREQVRIAASKVTLGRIVIHLDEDLEKFAGTPDDIILQEGDTLTVPQKPAEVLVMGSVRNPTAIIHKEGEDIQYYINRSGGFSEAADPSGMYLLKADGSALTGFLRLRNVDAGDAILVPPRTQERYDWSWAWLAEIPKMVAQTSITFATFAALARMF